MPFLQKKKINKNQWKISLFNKIQYTCIYIYLSTFIYIYRRQRHRERVRVKGTHIITSLKVMFNIGKTYVDVQGGKNALLPSGDV